MFKQDPADTSLHDESRKPSWYKKALNMASHWRSIPKPSTQVTSSTRHWKSPNPKSSSRKNPAETNPSNKGTNKLRKCTSMRVANSFTRVCLCAPISSYNEVFGAEFPPRRSYSFPRSSSSSKTLQERLVSPPGNVVPARLSAEGGGVRRPVFRGKSLKDDVLMRRFVLEEEAMMEVRRRNNQMEIIRRRSSMVMRRKKLGPSRLSKLVIDEADDEIN
ncbi:hypothetical protein LINPERPRIM_LOCUS8332 [Linum perenne]